VLLGRSYIAWSAVVAGSLTALALLVLLGSFGGALGIGAYRGGTFGAGAALWAIVSFFVAFFAGGCLVSYLAPHSEQHSGVVHGMMAWVLAVVIMSAAATLTVGLASGGIGFAPSLLLMPGNEVTYGQFVGAVWTAFFCLLFGLIASIFGGMVGYTGKLSITLFDSSVRQTPTTYIPASHAAAPYIPTQYTPAPYVPTQPSDPYGIRR